MSEYSAAAGRIPRPPEHRMRYMLHVCFIIIIWDWVIYWRNKIFLPKKHISFAQKHISFAQNVITRVRVYTFRPTKNLWILLELGYLLTPNLPGTLTRKPVKFPEQVFQPSSGSPVSGLVFRAKKKFRLVSKESLYFVDPKNFLPGRKV